jgi:hypothetical protein
VAVGARRKEEHLSDWKFLFGAQRRMLQNVAENPMYIRKIIVIDNLRLQRWQNSRIIMAPQSSQWRRKLWPDFSRWGQRA